MVPWGRCCSYAALSEGNVYRPEHRNLYQRLCLVPRKCESFGTFAMLRRTLPADFIARWARYQS